MKIAISAETTIDLTKELLDEFDIKTIPFNVMLGDKEGKDGDITREEIIEFVAKTKILPKTSALNQFQYTEFFEGLLKEYDAVIHFSLSSGLSSSCQNAINASKELKNVYVIDSQSLSTGIALLAIYGRKLANAGKSAKDIFKLCSERVNSVQASFELKRVDYLYKGGRCSALALLGANILKIRPQIIVKEGKMIAGKKYRGNFEHVVSNYCKDVLEQFDNPDLDVAFVTYTTASKEAIDIAIKHLEDRGFKNIYITRAGATITSHCGEDTMGILYINDGEHII